MDDRYRKNDSGSLELLNSPHFHDTSKYNCLKEDNVTNDWTLYTKDGGRVEIYSISQFGDDLQLSRFPPRKRQACALGALKSTGRWRSFMVKISRGSDVQPPHKENKNKKSPSQTEKKRFRGTIHLLVFTQGVLLAKSPMQSLQNVRL